MFRGKVQGVTYTSITWQRNRLTVKEFMKGMNFCAFILLLLTICSGDNGGIFLKERNRASCWNPSLWSEVESRLQNMQKQGDIISYVHVHFFRLGAGMTASRRTLVKLRRPAHSVKINMQLFFWKRNHTDEHITFRFNNTHHTSLLI